MFGVAIIDVRPIPQIANFAQKRALWGVIGMAQMVIRISGAAANPWPNGSNTDEIVTIPYADLTATLLRDHLPDAIVLPLFGAGFDALDALARLARFGYAGPVIVTGPALPNPTLIARELSAAAPGMAVSLIGPMVVPETLPQTGLSRL